MNNFKYSNTQVITKRTIWGPSFLCAVVVLLNAYTELNSSGQKHVSSLFVFLPVCFYMVGVVQFQLWKRMERLESALANKEGGEGEPGKEV